MGGVILYLSFTILETNLQSQQLPFQDTFAVSILTNLAMPQTANFLAHSCTLHEHITCRIKYPFNFLPKISQG